MTSENAGASIGYQLLKQSLLTEVPKTRTKMFDQRPVAGQAERTRYIARDGVPDDVIHWETDAHETLTLDIPTIRLASRELNALQGVMLKGFGKRVARRLEFLTAPLDQYGDQGFGQILRAHTKQQITPDEVYFEFAMLVAHNASSALDDHINEALLVSVEAPQTPLATVVRRLNAITLTSGKSSREEDPRFVMLYQNLQSGMERMGAIIKAAPKVCTKYGIPEFPVPNLNGNERTALYLDIINNSKAFIAEDATMPSAITRPLVSDLWHNMLWNYSTPLLNDLQLYAYSQDRIRLDYSENKKRMFHRAAEKPTDDKKFPQFVGCSAFRLFDPEPNSSAGVEPSALETIWTSLNPGVARIYKTLYTDAA